MDFIRGAVCLPALHPQRGQSKVCHGSASPLPPDVTARQRLQTFREPAADLYVHSAGFRGLARILELLGCGVGPAMLWRDVQVVAPGRMPDPQAALTAWVEVDETRLSIGAKSTPWPWSRAPRANDWTGSRAPCTCSAPWGGTSGASTRRP